LGFPARLSRARREGFFKNLLQASRKPGKPNTWNHRMKAKLIAVSMCALFALALVTVRLNTREAMLCYRIAELEMYEQLLLERLAYVKSRARCKTGAVSLLNRANEQGIQLILEDPAGNQIPLLETLERDGALD
jgi:hypothetical protein